MSDKLETDEKKLSADVKAGGCAAKLGSAELRKLLADLPVKPAEQLIAGIKHFEDAAVYKISEDIAIIETIDFFPPLVDDPFLFGQIAACNALSDVYAMGGKPIVALNVVCFPSCDFPLEVLEKIVRGGADKVAEAGATLAGGHSIQLDVPVYGLAVTGTVHPQETLTNNGARPGDCLLLTKPIGTGVGLLGLKGGELADSEQEVLLASLTKLNDVALSTLRQGTTNALTDITGFGLAGHISELAAASGLNAHLSMSAVEYLPAVERLAREGFVPAGAYGNRQSFEELVNGLDRFDLEYQDLIFDPQTSGGLLAAVPAGEQERHIERLREAGLSSSMIGTLLEPEATQPAGNIELVDDL